jgi:hypothetical protein
MPPFPNTYLCAFSTSHKRKRCAWSEIFLRMAQRLRKPCAWLTKLQTCIYRPTLSPRRASMSNTGNAFGVVIHCPNSFQLCSPISSARRTARFLRSITRRSRNVGSLSESAFGAHRLCGDDWGGVVFSYAVACCAVCAGGGGSLFFGALECLDPLLLLKGSRSLPRLIFSGRFPQSRDSMGFRRMRSCGLRGAGS